MFYWMFPSMPKGDIDGQIRLALMPTCSTWYKWWKWVNENEDEQEEWHEKWLENKLVNYMQENEVTWSCFGTLEMMKHDPEEFWHCLESL